ncbi:MAG: TSUP family transporter [Phycisphaerae bacterium]
MCILSWSLLPPEIQQNLVLFLVVGSISAGLSTMAKAGFGGGVGMLSTPLMVMAIGDSRMALGIMLPMLVVSDYVIVVQWWRQWNTKAAMSLLPGAIIGLVLGWITLAYVLGVTGGDNHAAASAPGRPPVLRSSSAPFLPSSLPPVLTSTETGGGEEGRKGGQEASMPASAGAPAQNRPAGAASAKDVTNAWMMLAIGLIALGFVVLHVVRSMRKDQFHFRPVLWQATAVGTAAGFTSTLAHAAGPIVTMYLLPQGMSKSRFVATTALYYWIGNQLKLLPYWQLGMIDAHTLGANLVLLPAVVVGAVLGVYLHRRLGEKNFSRTVYFLLALAGVDLIWHGAAKLW